LLPDDGTITVQDVQSPASSGCTACFAGAACDGTGNGNGDTTAPCFSVAADDTEACPTYSVAGCVVSGDVVISSNQNLLDLKTAVASECGEAEAWSISGGLSVYDADDVVNLLPLQYLEAINGKFSSGYSLYIWGNGELVSIAALGNLHGALQGGMGVHLNRKLASLSGLELLTGVAAKNDHGYSLEIQNNAVLCLSAEDRARFTDGTRFSLPDAGNSGVTFTQAERTTGCTACTADAACGGSAEDPHECFSVSGAVAAICPSVDGCAWTGDVLISSNQDLLDLKAAVEAVCGEGEAWSISGGLKVLNANDVVDLLPLQHLVAIDGKGSNGWSLYINGNDELVSIAALGNLLGALQGELYVTSNLKLATLDGLEGLEGMGKADNGRSVYIGSNNALTSIRGLRGLRGLLPGSLYVYDNRVLASLSGLELLTGVADKDNWGYSLYIANNAVLCLSAEDRARFTDGTRFSLPDAGISGVYSPQAERTAGCTACFAGAACDGTGNGDDTTAPCFSVAAAGTEACLGAAPTVRIIAREHELTTTSPPTPPPLALVVVSDDCTTPI
jgi:hypothetical protein